MAMFLCPLSSATDVVSLGQLLGDPMLPAQTSYVDAPLKRNSYFLPRTTTLSKVQQEGRKAGRHSDNVFPRERGKEQSAGDADEQFVGMSCILRAVGIGKRLRIPS